MFGSFVADAGELQKDENDHGQSHNNSGDLADKHPDPFCGPSKNTADGGQMVRGHFHDKGCGFLVL